MQTMLRSPHHHCETTDSSAVVHTHTQAFNGPFSGTTWVSHYQKGKTNLDFTEARDSEWQRHQLGRMQVCTSLQTTTPVPHHSDFYRADALPAAQPTASKHWRRKSSAVAFIQYLSPLLRRAAHPVGRWRHRVLDLFVRLCVCTCRRLLDFMSLSAPWLSSYRPAL